MVWPSVLGSDESQENHAVVLSASSDIGSAIADRWLSSGLSVSGTFNTESETVVALRERGATLAWCDLGDVGSIDEAAKLLSVRKWNRLVLAAGSQKPIGLFGELDIAEWEESIVLNFSRQLRFLHRMLASRSSSDARVLLFAGGGTNTATLRYSAYTVSKIASIKMAELLAAEYPRTCFTVLGPGWVKTKIHEATLSAPDLAGDNWKRTVEHFELDDFVPMEQVLDCVDWIFAASAEAVNGRNLSVAHDGWKSPSFEGQLLADSGLGKLRRFGNDALNIGGTE